MTLIRQLRTWPVWDFFFPPICEHCGAALNSNDVLFCSQCWANAPRVDPRGYPKLKHVDMLSAVYHFSAGNIVQAAVHALKYDGFDLVGQEMARRMVQQIPKRFVSSEVHWEPVPLHWKRRMERSFNQSRCLTEALERELHKETSHSLLKRVRNTPSQTAYTFRERSQNVRDAFKLVIRKEIPKSVLLIDDVVTTGATVNECARALKQAGVEWVGAFAFALAGKP
ncbi:ComF family protein [bacterium]|nr:MAG: ComF family protein [bacterium]